MSRTFCIIALGVAALWGCAAQPPQAPPRPVAPAPTVDVADYQALRAWLELQQSVAKMTPAKVMSELARTGKPQSPQQWFYFGLLNQQLKTYTSWTRARDAFREVHAVQSLSDGQRQLADIFERYNQHRINWHQEYTQIKDQHTALQQQLQAAQEENRQLEQKIQAITDLETTISTRKEQ